MSTSTAMSHNAHVNRRGDDTRERLLDAVEALIAEQGFRSLTHRLIAQRADVHVALLNYHFGNKEQLIEEAVARKAARLLQIQKDACAALRTRGAWTVEDVLWAYWTPFNALTSDADPSWRNYLCLVARLDEHDDLDDRMFMRHFGHVQRECLYALRKVLPDLSEDALTAGFRYCRALFSREILARCRECGPAGERQLGTKPEGLVSFLSGGLRALMSVDTARSEVV